MNLTSAKQIREADRIAIQEYRIPSTTLMENAALALADAAEKMSTIPCVAVFCGSGNNGGDGIAVSRILLEKGWTVRCFLVGSRDRMTADAREMEKRLLAAGGILEDDPTGAASFLPACGLIIDAIYGIGLNREISGSAKDAIAMINASGIPVLSADIASGIEADTGRILGCAVNAAHTVTFSLAKPGCFSDPGSAISGTVRVADIGIPSEVLKEAVTSVHALLPTEVSLPPRAPISHKSDFGKLLIVGGSVGFTGAPTFSSRAAVRSGAGLVWLGVPADIYAITAIKNEEAMPFPLSDADDLLSRADRCDVVAIGPGMGREKDAIRLCRRMIRDCQKPMIIDADGLFALAKDMTLLEKRNAATILTPHEGEFVRMGGTLSGDRITDARSFAMAHNCILVLKGHRSVIAFPDGEVYLSTTGNAGMAKGGSGDVLTGILAATVAQFGEKQGVLLGVLLHGLAGDLCRADLGEYAMTPTDVIAYLPQATRALGAK